MWVDDGGGGDDDGDGDEGDADEELGRCAHW